MLNKEELPTYTQQQIDEINKKNSRRCLVIVFNVVYDLDKFSSRHPGGERLIIQAAGEILDQVMSDGNHNLTETQVQRQLAKYKVGFFENPAILPEVHHHPNPINASLSWFFS